MESFKGGERAFFFKDRIRSHNGHMIHPCPDCDGIGILTSVNGSNIECLRCNGSGKVVGYIDKEDM